MTPAILAIDQGTTSSRAIVFSLSGEMISSAQKEHQQIYPHSGWVEHDAEEIWHNVRDVCEQAYREAVTKGFEAQTIGITNQRETIVAWHKETGQVLHHALVWQDKRTAKFCADLKNIHGDVVQQKTGLPLDPYFSASKMKWLIENVDSVQKAAQENQLAFGTMDSFVLNRLTGGQVHATDISNASRTLLFNIHKCDWDEELLDIFAIPKNTLPEVKANTAEFGVSVAGILPQALPIQGMAGDQQAATIGQVCFEKGMLKSTYGTGCFAMLNTGETPVVSKNGLLTTILYQMEDKVTYGLEGSIFVAGSAIQWLRDRIKLIDHAKETEQLAQASNDVDEVYMVPAFAGLGAPYWDSNASGTLTGMRLDTQKQDVVRATLDAMAFQTYDLMQAMQADTSQHISALRVDGGMVANNWLLQRMADILDMQIERPEVIETTALGAAYLAGLQSGLYKDIHDVEKHWQCQQIFESHMETFVREHKIKGWQKAVEKSRL